MVGVAAAEQDAERAAEARQRYIGYTKTQLQPKYVQRKAQEYLMERPNTTLNNFCIEIIQKGLILEVSSTFVFHEGQTKAELATLAEEVKILRSECKEHHVNAIAVNPQTFHPDQQRRQKPAARFCNYCHKNGHRLNWCRKKMRDEEVRKVRFQMSSRRKTLPTLNYSTGNLNQRPQNDHTLSHFPGLYDKNSLMNERLSNEEANRQHETE